MHELETLRAEAVAEQPGPHELLLFEAALWGPACDRRRAARRMRPGFSAGGFPLPPFRRGRLLAIDAGTALPPRAGHVENAGRAPAGDGCSATPLVLPAGPGGPGLVHLHILPGTAGGWQRRDGARIGLAVAGRGLVHREAGPPLALYPGRAWRIPPGARHRFETGVYALDMLVFEAAGAWAPAGEAARALEPVPA